MDGTGSTKPGKQVRYLPGVPIERCSRPRIGRLVSEAGTRRFDSFRERSRRASKTVSTLVSYARNTGFDSLGPSPRRRRSERARFHTAQHERSTRSVGTDPASTNR